VPSSHLVGILRPNLGGVLHFQRVQATLSIDQEIHLDFRPCLSVMQLVIAGRIVTPHPKMLGNETLQRRAIDLRRSIKRTGRPFGAEDDGIKKEKFRMCRKFALRPPGEDRHSKSQKKILQYFQIALVLRFMWHSRATLARFSTAACEKLMASRKRDTLPMLRTNPSICTSARK
jgi:hypothetical protein